MEKFEELKFNLPPLKGISAKNIEEHLKLYAGYVKNTNAILEKIPEYQGYEKEDSFATYVVSEIERRFSFEFNGIRNHEYYFKSLEGGAKPLPENSKFLAEIKKMAPSFDAWLPMFKTLAMTRGIGWAVLGWDPETKKLLPVWIDEQHMGQLNGLRWVLCIDMWEHAYVYDYPTSEKKKYIDAFFENINWEVIEKNFIEAQK
jgi:Fe-Mn family superoxide dismutase